MSESSPNQEEALRYVLGELREGERRRFESRLKDSSELRATVREMQEGTLALALSMPQRVPPVEVLKAVQSAVARERTRKRSFQLFRRRLLAISLPLAACLIGGVILSVFWINGHHQPTEPGSQASLAPMANSNFPNFVVASTSTNTRSSESARTEAVTLPPRTEPSPTTKDVAFLHRQVVELNTKVAQLSRELDSQSALASVSSQLKLLQLINPGAGADENAGVPTPSVEEQRLLLLALERQLGWVQPTQTLSPNPRAKTSSLAPGEGTESSVDFVDLNPNDPDIAQDSNPQTSAAPATAATDPLSSTTNSSIPGFVFGTNLVFVLNPSHLPPTTGPLRIHYSNDNDGTSTSIPIDIGRNPIIVSTPIGNSPGDGHTISITVGASSVLGKFPPPGDVRFH